MLYHKGRNRGRGVLRHMENIPEEAYYEASWSAIVEIAKTEYGMDQRTASIYAWVLFGRMNAKDYKKMVH